MGRPKRWCEIDDCGRDAVGWGMCRLHWQRWKKWGDPRRVGSRRQFSEADRFWTHVDRTGECWRWIACRKYGYGTFYVRRDGINRMVQAHRYSYELEHGPLAESVTLDHLCHTRAIRDCRSGPACPHRACVRPEHLEPTTLVANIRRGGNATKTHCKRDHGFTPENTWRNKRGGRTCKTCLRLLAAEFRARQRAERVS